MYGILYWLLGGVFGIVYFLWWIGLLQYVDQEIKKEGFIMVELAWYWWAGIAAVIGYLVYYFWFR